MDYTIWHPTVRQNENLFSFHVLFSSSAHKTVVREEGVGNVPWFLTWSEWYGTSQFSLLSSCNPHHNPTGKVLPFPPCRWASWSWEWEALNKNPCTAKAHCFSLSQVSQVNGNASRQALGSSTKPCPPPPCLPVEWLQTHWISRERSDSCLDCSPCYLVVPPILLSGFTFHLSAGENNAT